MSLTSIAALNQLPHAEKRSIYCKFIPHELLDRYQIPPGLIDRAGNPLLELRCEAGTTDVTLSLRHQKEAEDPVLFAHLTDTINGQLHVLLYILNDPTAIRYDVDRDADGDPTHFGLKSRNLEAEQAAMQAGLAPGQIRRGPGLLKESLTAFEGFVRSLEHEVYFIDPLHYHNAIVFERYGFAYQQGRRRMETYQLGFSAGGELVSRLDGGTPFRQPWMADSIRGRSWALHDGIAGSPFSDVTMYRRLGHHSGVDTFPGGSW